MLELTVMNSIVVIFATEKKIEEKTKRNEKQRRNGFAAMENLRVQSFSKEIDLKEQNIIRLASDEQPGKTDETENCLCTAIKIERANVKIHINYCYNSNLYALFTCFVFAHHRITATLHSSGHQNPCSSISLCVFYWTICLCCDHFGFTILFRCNFLLRVLFSIFYIVLFRFTFSIAVFFRVLVAGWMVENNLVVVDWVLHYHQL